MSLENSLLFALGGLIGALTYHFYSSRFNGTKALEKELSSTRTAFAQYKQDVSGHFQKTAGLVNTMTQSYRDVHEHLSMGAQELSLDGLATQEQFQSLASPASMEAQDYRVIENQEQARDYADGSSGTLDESFGFNSAHDIVDAITGMPSFEKAEALSRTQEINREPLRRQQTSNEAIAPGDMENKNTGSQSQPDSTTAQGSPPRDYAHKDSDELGTLHESYGHADSYQPK